MVPRLDEVAVENRQLREQILHPSQREPLLEHFARTQRLIQKVASGLQVATLDESVRLREPHVLVEHVGDVGVERSILARQPDVLGLELLPLLFGALGDADVARGPVRFLLLLQVRLAEDGSRL